MKIILISMIFLLTIAINAQEKIAVIANKSVAASSVNVSVLKNLFSLDASEIGGSKVKLFDYSSENGASKTLYGALGKSQVEHKKIWMKAKLTGGKIPSTVGSEAEMLQKIASTPDAVGYIPQSQVTDAVKVLMTLP